MSKKQIMINTIFLIFFLMVSFSMQKRQDTKLPSLNSIKNAASNMADRFESKFNITNTDSTEIKNNIQQVLPTNTASFLQKNNQTREDDSSNKISPEFKTSVKNFTDNLSRKVNKFLGGPEKNTTTPTKNDQDSDDKPSDS